MQISLQFVYFQLLKHTESVASRVAHTVFPCRTMGCVQVLLPHSTDSMRQWIQFALWYRFYAYLILWERKSQSGALAPHKVGVQKIKLANEFIIKRAWKAFVAEQVWLLLSLSAKEEKHSKTTWSFEVNSWVSSNRNLPFHDPVLLLKLC